MYSGPAMPTLITRNSSSSINESTSDSMSDISVSPTNTFSRKQSPPSPSATTVTNGSPYPSPNRPNGLNSSVNQGKRAFDFNYAATSSGPTEFSPKTSMAGPSSPYNSANHWQNAYTGQSLTQTLMPEALDTPADEKDDIFLPLSPDTAAPFSINFPHRDSVGSDGAFSPPTTSKSSMSAAERREHSRRHSRIHSRNLSVFFPKPGESSSSPFAPLPETPEHEAVNIPSASVKAWSAGNKGSIGSAHYARQGSNTSLNSMNGQELDAKKVNARRGHHHRHSLSHKWVDFFCACDIG